jgi:hypothetical protein
VERLFQTLQDRMCKAMRLQGIDNIEQVSPPDEYSPFPPVEYSPV